MDRLTKICKECEIKIKPEQRSTEGSTFPEVTLTGTKDNVKRAIHDFERILGLVSVCRVATCILWV